MSKIIATGKFFGSLAKFEITVNAEKLYIDCKTEVLSKKRQSIVEEHLANCIKTAEAIGGTYYPPENTLTAAYVGLQNGFFDSKRNVEIKVEGKLEPIPYEDGVIY